MLKLILWLIIFWLVWKIVRGIARAMQQQAKPPQSPPPVNSGAPPYRNIQDADFEDITPPDKPDKDK